MYNNIYVFILKFDGIKLENETLKLVLLLQDIQDCYLLLPSVKIYLPLVSLSITMTTSLTSRRYFVI